MVYCWSCCWGTVWYDSYLLSCWVYWATTNMTDQWSWVFESSWLSHLFNLVADWKHSDVRFLSPADDIVTHYLKSTNLTLTLRESESLLDLTSKTEHVETIISGDDESILGDKKTSKCFLFYRWNARNRKVIISFGNFQNLDFFACPVK